MRRILTASVLGSLCVLAGCDAQPAPRPRVVERDVYYDSRPGYVVERDVVVVDEAPPPPRVEVVTVVPYRGAVWMPGHWSSHGRHRWVWVPGHWH
jgi:YXWGXW repeat-containing protein